MENIVQDLELIIHLIDTSKFASYMYLTLLSYF